MHESFVSCAFAFERRRARNFMPLVQIRKLTSLCLCHQIEFHVRWIASESICSDDPSTRHDLSQHASRDSFCAGELLNEGNEGVMLARPTESVLVEPETSSRDGAAINSTNISFRTLKPLNVNKMESLENTGLDTKECEKDKIRCDNLRGKDQCPRVSEETATRRQAHSDDGKTFQKIHLTPGSSRSEKLRSLPPSLAKVPPAHFGDRKSAAAVAEVDEALVAFFNKKYRMGYSSSAGGDLTQPLVAYKTRHSGPSIDAALCIRTRKEIKDGDRWKSDRSALRYERRALFHKSFHRLPATCRAYALKCENALHKVISGSTPNSSVQMHSAR